MPTPKASKNLGLSDLIRIEYRIDNKALSFNMGLAVTAAHLVYEEKETNKPTVSGATRSQGIFKR